MSWYNKRLDFFVNRINSLIGYLGTLKLDNFIDCIIPLSVNSSLKVANRISDFWYVCDE